MIPGRVKVDKFALICFTLQTKYGDDPLPSEHHSELPLRFPS